MNQNDLYQHAFRSALLMGWGVLSADWIMNHQEVLTK